VSKKDDARPKAKNLVRGWRLAPFVTDPSKEHIEAIGSLITRWALIESLVRQCTWVALGVDQASGRIAVRVSPRVQENVVMIDDLMAMHGLASTIDRKKLAKNLTAFQSVRDLFAHSAWRFTPEGHFAIEQIGGGEWQPDPKLPPIKRRVLPQGSLGRC
jgi:hypothetical protein